MMKISRAIILVCNLKTFVSFATFEERCAIGDCEALEGSAMLQSKSRNRDESSDVVKTFTSAAGKIRDARLLQKENGPAENSSVQQQIFEGIYEENKWGGSESLSGKGSELGQTDIVRECLGDWIEKYNVTVLLDIPCGDANWQGHIPGIEKVDYYGYDISTRALDLAREKNKEYRNMRFDFLDLSTSDPPEPTSDPQGVNMIIVKEVLQHVPTEMGLQMLRHAKSAGIKWLAVTTDPSFHGPLDDMKIGDYFLGPNVQAPPFNFPKEQEVCEAATEAHEKMRLFDLRDWDGGR